MLKQDKKIKVIDIVAKPENSSSIILEKKNEFKKEKESFLIKNQSINSLGEEIKEKLNIDEIENKDTKEEDFLEKEGIVDVSKFKLKIKKYFLIFISLLVLTGVGYLAAVILPRVEIKIITKKTFWKITESVAASKNFGGIDIINKQIPASFFSEKKNVSLLFPASGKKFIEKKAFGEIIIYNAYSSDSQILVKGTRFETLDGKIFKLDSKIIVPGAKIEEGKIIPSSIKAMVTAEKAGESYNVGLVDKFFIPGFKGSVKYNGFYGKSETGIAGGFVGEAAYITDEDIKSAKLKITESLKESLSVIILSQIPKDFKIIDGAKQFSIIKEDIKKETDDNGNFSVFLEGEISMIAFKEDDLFKLIDIMANNFFKISNEGNEKSKFETNDRKLDYGAARIDFKNGRLSFAFNYEGVYWRPIDIEKFKKLIFSNKENELKIKIFSMPGIEKATVSFWPFWVKSVPGSVNKINVVVE